MGDENERSPELRLCEDCEESIPANERRVRCPHCSLLVCHWCRHHVHNGLHVKVSPNPAAD